MIMDMMKQNKEICWKYQTYFNGILSNIQWAIQKWQKDWGWDIRYENQQIILYVQQVVWAHMTKILRKLSRVIGWKYQVDIDGILKQLLADNIKMGKKSIGQDICLTIKRCKLFYLAQFQNTFVYIVGQLG
ncbi:unnamed protein product [Paramecium octaurelia]|uniref:Uncharacterized protein n=1 Tax=Paramecium octaurelia TaxID=43137 RepID=A0A8S1XWU0_PAROT|nr:unnamed protein product [Paramecium octaurelia]